MPVTRGTVDRIVVGPSFCCVTVRTAPTQQTLLLLWSYPTQEDNASNRLLHGGFLGMVRDAYLHNRRIELTYAASSAIVDSVALIE
jgi:hypothetical protein